MKTILTAAALAALLAVPASAAPAKKAPRGSADVVKVAPAAKVVTAVPGTRVTFDVSVEIAERWHLYAHGDTSFIGVDLVPDEDFPLQEFQAEYPAGHEGVFFGEKVRVIEGTNVIKASALVPAGMQGEQPLELKLTVQACDDKTCLAPAAVPVSLVLKVR